jgi:ribosome-associated protein YbcJ (S4-like RNA binding protein)
MRFYLQRESDFIYLDQVLKATGIFGDYVEIRQVIDSGRVSVNGDLTKHRRQMLHAGDVVRFRDYHIMITAHNERPTRLADDEIEHIRHGQGPQKWIEKPLKPARRKKSE